VRVCARRGIVLLISLLFILVDDSWLHGTLGEITRTVFTKRLSINALAIPGLAFHERVLRANPGLFTARAGREGGGIQLDGRQCIPVAWERPISSADRRSGTFHPAALNTRCHFGRKFTIAPNSLKGDRLRHFLCGQNGHLGDS